MYEGYYINLDRSPERRALMEAQIDVHGAASRYRRFPAVDGASEGLAAPGLTSGELGCLISHFRLLDSHRDGASHLHVVEDDVVFASCTLRSVDRIIQSGLLDEYDILFTETAVEMDPYWCREARGLYKALIHRGETGAASGVEFRLVPYLGGMTSYLINRRSVRLVRDILSEELERGARHPVDILIRDAAAKGKLRVKSLFPFITTFLPGQIYSTVRQDDSLRKSRLAMELLRYSFFVESDMNAALDLAARQLTNPDEDLHERLHGSVARMVSSDIFQRH
jgi:GR25 family glycosyltransferase involved in LPS biosynthesis